MDAKTLGWLADTVKEAIATAAAPLNAQIETLTAQLQQLQNSQAPGYDDTEIKQAVQALRESIPEGYDDGEIKKQLADLGGAIVDVEMRLGAKQAQDAESLLGCISDVAKSIPAAYDDTALRRQIEDVAKSVPAAYDDTSLRSEMEVLLKGVDAQLDHLRKQAPADGKPGADGRDALQLEVLPAIDEQKSYTRGTYAKHAGGLWRAFEQTSGMRGWECIVEGVKELQVDMVDKRLSVKAVMSSGALAEMVKELPIQIYRGVFKSEDPYHQGDTVTWAGSLWHCNVTGTKALPGDGSADWTLAVKKGRDGREVVKTERKEGPVQL